MSKTSIINLAEELLPIARKWAPNISFGRRVTGMDTGESNHETMFPLRSSERKKARESTKALVDILGQSERGRKYLDYFFKTHLVTAKWTSDKTTALLNGSKAFTYEEFDDVYSDEVAAELFMYKAFPRLEGLQRWIHNAPSFYTTAKSLYSLVDKMQTFSVGEEIITKLVKQISDFTGVPEVYVYVLVDIFIRGTVLGDQKFSIAKDFEAKSGLSDSVIKRVQTYLGMLKSSEGWVTLTKRSKQNSVAAQQYDYILSEPTDDGLDKRIEAYLNFLSDLLVLQKSDNAKGDEDKEETRDNDLPDSDNTSGGNRRTEDQSRGDNMAVDNSKGYCKDNQLSTCANDLEAYKRVTTKRAEFDKMRRRLGMSSKEFKEFVQFVRCADLGCIDD